ncbi:hypothetical protein GCM10007071_23410 [Marinobacter zhanjiangensis]|uniref:Uncharacterized protein n=1 Tax=Marinobacter zhanjiangensis TaxID=578215 RepID=A0ABQ3B2Z5_9GAMM|nr:hypothetical protein GCM10007071_23410 [Marinobacter zhanjiangensis]
MGDNINNAAHINAAVVTITPTEPVIGPTTATAATTGQQQSGGHKAGNKLS